MIEIHEDEMCQDDRVAARQIGIEQERVRVESSKEGSTLKRLTNIAL